MSHREEGCLFCVAFFLFLFTSNPPVVFFLLFPLMDLFFFADCHFSSQVAIWLFLPSSRCICRLARLPTFFCSLLSTFFSSTLSFIYFFSFGVSAGNLGTLWQTAGWANDRLPGPLNAHLQGSNLRGRVHHDVRAREPGWAPALFAALREEDGRPPCWRGRLLTDVAAGGGQCWKISHQVCL